ncbi:MAG: aspartoacylase [Cyanobium sp.]
MGRVLVVGATHGNERNGAWLLEQWRRRPEALEHHGLAVDLVVGNPAAAAEGRRYLDRDLNRSFEPSLLADPLRQEREVLRARELLRRHGAEGEQPALVVIDLHSTTSAMGNSLVMYGRRPADLALAAAVQLRLGLPIYLHEGDPAQTGYLVERWPGGLVVEVGPVPQGVIHPQICRQTSLAVATTLELLALARRGALPQPRTLVVHRHLCSLDLPRHGDGSPSALIHPLRQGRDWQPLRPGEPLLQDAAGRTLPYEPPAGLENVMVWPVFINEAAYGEKGIALSLTERQVWPVEPAWAAALEGLAAGLQPQTRVACSRVQGRSVVLPSAQ